MNQKSKWIGYRTFIVDRREPESETVTSFYLIPEDGVDLPTYLPGQALGFSIDVPGQKRPVARNYTISDSPKNADYYRVSIKRELAPEDKPNVPAGIMSNFFHDNIAAGSRVKVRAPSGQFVLRPEDKGPVLLLSGGVGCTPMIAMLNAIVEAESSRKVWYVHGVRNRRQHAFGAQIRSIAATHANIFSHICFSRPEQTDSLGVDYDSAGHITIDLLGELLPDCSFQVFMCGSTPFMRSLYGGLIDLGFDELQIVYEFFGKAFRLK